MDAEREFVADQETVCGVHEISLLGVVCVCGPDADKMVGSNPEQVVQ
jgi:hypothetical protein